MVKYYQLLSFLKAGKRQPDLYESNVFIRAQSKAWMDEQMMLEWID